MSGFRSKSKKQTSSDAAAAAAPVSPFTQAQILHLMRTEFARARRYGFSVACVLAQFDRLPRLIDMYGVDLADTIRRQLVHLVNEKTRGSDYLGLMTEDRYLLLLPQTNEAQAAHVANRLQQQFELLDVKVNGNSLALSLSFGVAGSEEQDMLFFDTILSRAEAALTWAIDAGGNRVEIFRKDRFVSS